MASDNSAAVISLHQDPPKPKAMTGAERAKAYRDRKRKKASAGTVQPRKPAPAADVQSTVSPPDPLPSPNAVTPLSVTPAPGHVTPLPVTLSIPPVTPSRLNLASATLMGAAIALASVGVAINGWFARSLGSSDVAGWLFLALGMAADLIALGMPSCAANLWQRGHRGTALLGWSLWLVTFVFAVTAGLGFASTNVSDVTLTRASRVTSAVTAAQAALSDAMAARDRECKGGVGKFCREREAAVVDRRQVLEGAVAAVGLVADPQTDAAVKLVAWASLGALRPAPDDFAMLRLLLLALLPQIGGLLMMVARRSAR
ncbi:hypothetical protein [Bradyrhizobium zhanjiangense]|uniref:Uncharacterized protein n=1 Tax=Bradyrhizobium zhanjiangense TaxID=1325107 RepID=A0A4Q0Q8R3_9BRAD|nr:hypothetical protein [Bradyrhizobium zhanjiangense]RXG85260.1 hypothetical protein EAS61_36765 [Bradyrhizobium zhanjiangense]